MAGTNKNTTKSNKVNTLEAMAYPISVMHSLNNKKAISSDFMDGYQPSPELKQRLDDAHTTLGKVFKKYVETVRGIYDALTPWALKFDDHSATDEELDAIYADVIKKWAELNTVCKYIWIRPNDVRRLCGFMLKMSSTSRGTVNVLTNLTDFRRMVEAMLGVRMAQTAVLSDSDYSTIKKYDSAVNNKEKALIRLNGDGDKKTGLNDKLGDAEKKLADMKAIVKELGVPAKEINEHPILMGYVQAVTDIKSQIAQANKAIKTADETISKLSDSYKDIMAKVNEITLP